MPISRLPCPALLDMNACPACPRLCLQGDVRFAEVMGLMGAKVEWAPYSITITGGQWQRQASGRAGQWQLSAQ